MDIYSAVLSIQINDSIKEGRVIIMKEFNICLVMAWVEDHKWKSQFHQREGIGIEYIAGSLRNNGFNVDLINAELSYMNVQDVVEQLQKKEYDIIGFSCTAQRTYIPSVKIIEKIRNNGYKGYIVVGGEFATLAHTEILDHCSNIDAVSLGEGEYTTVELARAIKEHQSLENIKGLYWRENDGTCKNNGFRERNTDLDSLPFPYRYDYINTDLVDEIRSGVNFGRIAAGRGCYGACTFCSTRYLYDGKNDRVVRTPKSVVDEIEHLYKEFGIDHIRFNDEVLYDGSDSGDEWLNEFVSLIKSRDLKIKIDCQLRSVDIKYDAIKKLKEIGLNYVFTGVESGSDTVLKRMNKKCTVEDNTRALEVLSKFDDLDVELGYIMFEPEMSMDELWDSYLWLKKFKRFATKYNVYNKLNSLYKTAIYYRLLNKKLLVEGDFWDRYNYSFVDKKVEIVLNTLEYTKGQMSPVHEILSDLRLTAREMHIKKADEASITALEQKTGQFNKIEKDFWFDYFEKVYNCVQNSEDLTSIIENSQTEINKIYTGISELKNQVLK